MIPQLVALVALAALTGAAPIVAPVDGVRIDLHKRAPLPAVDSITGFLDMDDLVDSLELVVHKYKSTREAFKKNTGQDVADALPVELLKLPTHPKLNRKRQAGNSLASQNGGQLWSGSVSIGTPAQKFNVDFDTGSSDAWVPSVYSTLTGKTNKYNSTLSSTYAPQNANFSITYGDGSSVSGPVVQETISVAGLTATSQSFSPIVTATSSFNNFAADGYLGLAYPSLSRMNQPSFFQTLVAQTGIPNVFGVKLSVNAGASELYLGGTNPKLYSGAISYAPVTQQSYWTIGGSSQPYVNKVATSSASPSNMIIDTGTTYIVAPSAAAKAFYANITGAAPYQNTGYYTVPCTTLNTMTANFAFGSSSRQFVVPSGYLNLGRLTATTCVSSLVGIDVGVGGWILGDAFLRAVYAVFDFGANQVGFATLV